MNFEQFLSAIAGGIIGAIPVIIFFAIRSRQCQRQ
jgi:F0F1-type ATP synthase assembly protein I